MPIRRDKICRQSVTDANRAFYDAIAQRYEEIDGRRSSALEQWLRAKLRELRKECSGGMLLDMGAGSGLVCRCARGIFDKRIALDVSWKILVAHRTHFDNGVVGDVGRLPFDTQSVDAITCFAVLHHLYDFELLVPEVARVLKPGGIFYSDHDMDKRFFSRFRIPLLVYRICCNRRRRYYGHDHTTCSDLYHVSEWHERGVDHTKLTELFGNRGMSVDAHFHWFGLSAYSNRIFGTKFYRYGWAPLLSLQAKKG